MKRHAIIALGLLVLAMGYFIVDDALDDRAPAQTPETAPAPPGRIVSMAPSITEVVFAVGLGDRLVGVTRFCDYPEPAQSIAKVGGFLDPNYEAIVALEPDLVIVLSIHDEVQTQLDALKIPTLALEHRTLEGIRNSVALVGKRCDADAQATALLDELDDREQSLKSKVAGLDRPTVLMSAGRDLASRQLEEVYAVGPGQWLDDVITLAGGVNAVETEATQFPVLTGEAILRMNPDVIVELAHDLETQSFSSEEIVADWNALPHLRAVEENRVVVIGGDFVSIPGPRYIMIAEALARTLHPEVDWDRAP